MNTPRILPLIGVAVAGVLALNLIGGARSLPQLLSAARAMAETAAPLTKPGKAQKPNLKALETPEANANPSLPPVAVASAQTVAPICAPGGAELAKSAGLSPAELEVLQSLGARRGQIDQREKDLDTQTQLLAAAEAKLDAKLKTMADLKGQIEALLGKVDQQTQSEVDRLSVVFTKMKPDAAAPLMATLDDKVRVPLAASFEATKPKVLADILSKMSAPDAKHLTELLARRFAPAQQLAQAVSAPPAPTAPPAGKTPPDKTPKATASADPTADAEKPATPPKAKPAPKKQVAKTKPKPVVKPKAKPVEDAKADAPTGPKPYASLNKSDAAKPAPTVAAAPTIPAPAASADKSAKATR